MTVRRLTVDASVVAVLTLATAAVGGDVIANLFDKTADARADLLWSPEFVMWWLASAAGMAALLVRGWLPYLALAGAGAMSLVHLTATTPLMPAMPLDVAPAIALFTIAAMPLPRQVSYAALAIGVGGACLPRLLGYPLQVGGPWVGLSLLPPTAMAVAWLIGDRTRIRRAYLHQATQRAHDLERERDQRAELATAAERARIARELHDAVAHGLSVMIIQAHAGASALNRKPDTTRAALAAIAATGRDSLTEMRRLLGLTKPDDPAQLTPLPGLADLPTLADRIQAAGLPVGIQVTGQPDNVPTGVALTAYRITQEALTNTLKHAGPQATAEVTIHCGPQAVELTIADSGKGTNRSLGQLTAGAGTGLRGMQERAALTGGTLAARGLEGGGFEVRARLPITATPQQPVTEPA